MLPSVTRTARDSENNCFPFFKNGDTTAQTSEQPRQSRGETPISRGRGWCRDGAPPSGRGPKWRSPDTRWQPGPADGWLQGRGPGPARERAVPALRSARKSQRGRSFTPSVPKFNRDNRDQAPGCRSPRDPALWLACRGRFPRSGRRSAGGAVGGGRLPDTHGRTVKGQAGIARTRLRRGAGGQGSRGGVGVPRHSPGPLSLLGPRRRRETLALVAATSPTP